MAILRILELVEIGRILFPAPAVLPAGESIDATEEVIMESTADGEDDELPF